MTLGNLLPVYDYKCQECQRVSTITHSIEVDPQVICVCKKPMVRIVSVPAVSFKGKGWGKD